MSYRESGRYYDGFLDWKGPKSKGWQNIWVLLQNTTLYLYQNKVVGTMKGVDKQIPMTLIKLDAKISVEVEKKEPLKFTVKANTIIHRFKAQRPQEVDIWRAYIVSFSSRTIPQEINQILLPGPRNDIIKALEEEFSLGPSVVEGAAPPVPTTSRPTRSSQGSTASTSSDSSMGRRLSSLSVSSLSSNTSTGRDSQKSQNVDMNVSEYRFYPDHLKDLDEHQTWFFKKISRNEAEEILWNNKDKGDLLIRHSESQENAFVISARLYVSPGQQEIRHYRIKRDGEFFVLDIDKQHPPILNLYEMLNYFIDQSGGPPRLRPLMTNDLKQLKLPQHLYERGFVTRVGQDPESGEWRPKPVPQEVLDNSDYLEPINPSKMRQSSQSPDTYPNTDYHQDTTQQPGGQNVRGVQQIIPRPKVSLTKMEEEQKVTKSIPSGSTESYYNADAIRQSRIPPRVSGSELMYMNQPPIPDRTANTPIYCTPPDPPPIQTIPSRVKQTSSELNTNQNRSSLDGLPSQPLNIPRPKLNPDEDSLKRQVQAYKTDAVQDELKKQLARRYKPS